MTAKAVVSGIKAHAIAAGYTLNRAGDFEQNRYQDRTFDVIMRRTTKKDLMNDSYRFIGEFELILSRSMTVGDRYTTQDTMLDNIETITAAIHSGFGAYSINYTLGEITISHISDMMVVGMPITIEYLGV